MRFTHLKYSFLVVIGLATLSARALNCTAARTKVERLICADQGLTLGDAQLNAAYAAKLKDPILAPSLPLIQKEWLKRRDACATAACLKDAYAGQLRFITAVSSEICANVYPPSALIEEVKLTDAVKTTREDDDGSDPTVNVTPAVKIDLDLDGRDEWLYLAHGGGSCGNDIPGVVGADVAQPFRARSDLKYVVAPGTEGYGMGTRFRFVKFKGLVYTVVTAANDAVLQKPYHVGLMHPLGEAILCHHQAVMTGVSLDQPANPICARVSDQRYKTLTYDLRFKPLDAGDPSTKISSLGAAVALPTASAKNLVVPTETTSGAGCGGQMRGPQLFNPAGERVVAPFDDLVTWDEAGEVVTIDRAYYLLTSFLPKPATPLYPRRLIPLAPAADQAPLCTFTPTYDYLMKPGPNTDFD